MQLYIAYDINKFLYNGWTPLLYATSSAQLDVIKYLVNNKADVNKHKGFYIFNLNTFFIIFYNVMII